MMSATQREEIIALLAEAIPDLSYPEAASALVARGTLKQGVHAAFEPFLRNPNTASLITSRDHPSQLDLEIDFQGGRTLRALLEKGKYDWSNEDVSDEHFPDISYGSRTVRLQLLDFGKVISSDEVLEECQARDLVPANPAELLALGAAYPTLQAQFPLVALGQSWRLPNGDEMVVCLAWHSMLRRVHLLCKMRRDWPAHCRFVATEGGDPVA